MAQQLQIDGTDINYINSIDWIQPIMEQSLNLIAVHQKTRLLVLRSAVMTAAEWATLIGKRGSVVSVTAPPVDDRNSDFITYYGAKVQSVTFRHHEGPNIRGVEVRLLVGV